MKRKLITILMLLVIVPLCAITAAGGAAHWSNYLKNINPVETGGFMVMSNVHWMMPHNWSHWVYEHYPTILYEPASRYLQSQFPNSKLQVWQPWSYEVSTHAPHWSSLIGAVLGLVVGIIASVLLIKYAPKMKLPKIKRKKKSATNTEPKQREQQPRKQQPKVETEEARQQRITDEQRGKKKMPQNNTQSSNKTSEKPARPAKAQAPQQQSKPAPDKKPTPEKPATQSTTSKPKPNQEPKPEPAQPETNKDGDGDDGIDDDDEIFDRIIGK